MSCFRPVAAYRDRHGLVKIGCGGQFAEQSFTVPCGRCIGCKRDRARSWAIRIMHEAQLWESNRFLTLTYSDEKLPASRSLEYGDFQGFMKRLRRQLVGVTQGADGRRPLRFFCAGEYGSYRQRPHFHAILFNLRIPDERPWQNGSFHSAMVEKIWDKGHVQVDDVTPRSAAYVAGYVNRKVYGKKSYDVYDSRTGEVLCERRPEFCCMSLKPGIGAMWFARFYRDLFPHDFAVQEGKRWKVPRYYWEKFKAAAKSDGERLRVEELEWKRFERAAARRSDATPERLAVREEVALARVRVYDERSDL